MASSFGTSKKASPSAGPTAADILKNYARYNSPTIDASVQNILAPSLLKLTMNWFSNNPLSLKNMNNWGRVMESYVEFNQLNLDAESAKPLAEYLNFAVSLPINQLIPTLEKKSPQFESFCDVVYMLSTESLHSPNQSLRALVKNKLIDAHEIMTKLDATHVEQMDYDAYVRDNPGEYRDTPHGLMLRSLASLSLAGDWMIPAGEAIYHNIWEVIESDDHIVFSDTLLEGDDVIAHLVQKLPNSTESALEYYQYFGDSLQPEQQQHILSMSLSVLDFPKGLTQLIDAVYHNDHDDEGFGLKIFTAINPAATVLGPYMDLYNNPRDMIEHLATLPNIKTIFQFADGMRNKENANELVAGVEP